MAPMVQGVLGGAELGHEVLGRLTGDDRLVCPSPKLGGLVPWRVRLQVDRAKLSQGAVRFSGQGQTSAEGPFVEDQPEGRSLSAQKTLVLQRFLASRSGMVPGPMPPPRDSRRHGTPPGLRLVGLPGSPRAPAMASTGSAPARAGAVRRRAPLGALAGGASTASR